MKSASSKGIEMASPASYQITVKGRLANHWADWFNGVEIVVERDGDGNLYTNLTCNVRDQAELFGILNRLNGLNLPLLLVALVSED